MTPVNEYTEVETEAPPGRECTFRVTRLIAAVEATQ